MSVPVIMFSLWSLNNFSQVYLQFFLQSMEFFLFAVLMFVDMIGFAALAVRYKYVDQIEAEKIAKAALDDKGHTNEAFTKDETKFWCFFIHKVITIYQKNLVDFVYSFYVFVQVDNVFKFRLYCLKETHKGTFCLFVFVS